MQNNYPPLPPYPTEIRLYDIDVAINYMGMPRRGPFKEQLECLDICRNRGDWSSVSQWILILEMQGYGQK